MSRPASLVTPVREKLTGMFREDRVESKVREFADFGPCEPFKRSGVETILMHVSIVMC